MEKVLSEVIQNTQIHGALKCVCVTSWQALYNLTIREAPTEKVQKGFGEEGRGREEEAVDPPFASLLTPGCQQTCLPCAELLSRLSIWKCDLAKVDAEKRGGLAGGE